MPVMIGRWRDGSRGINNSNNQIWLIASPDLLQPWIRFAGYSFPNDRLILRLIVESNARYFFERRISFSPVFRRFFQDLCRVTYNRQLTFYDLYQLRASKFYTPVRSAALEYLLETLNVGAPLQIATNFVTPEDMFSLSVIWGSEIGLTSCGEKLFIISQGVEGRVKFPADHTVLAHTHPTTSKDKTQVKDDLGWVKDQCAEIVITANEIIYITKNNIVNELRGETVMALDNFINRDTQLNAELFNLLHVKSIEILNKRDAGREAALVALQARLDAGKSSAQSQGRD